MDLRIGCRFDLDLPQPVHALVLVRPHESEAARVVRSALWSNPAVAVTEDIDPLGNRSDRLDLSPGAVSLHFDARVSVDPTPDRVAPDAAAIPVAALPAELLRYLRPSRYCESDLLIDTAFGAVGADKPGWGQVQHVMDWVHERTRFDYGQASPGHTATSVLASGEGVCRDFAHLAIALCRALNIPARYVFGYLPDIGVPASPDPMDFCAWVEVFLDGGWFTFDPRNNQRRIGRVVVGRGRDAADVPMLTTFGTAQLVDMVVWADRADDEAARSGLVGLCSGATGYITVT